MTCGGNVRDRELEAESQFGFCVGIPCGAIAYVWGGWVTVVVAFIVSLIFTTVMYVRSLGDGDGEERP